LKADVGPVSTGSVHEMRANEPSFCCCASANQFIGRPIAEDILHRIRAFTQKISVVVKKPQSISPETKEKHVSTFIFQAQGGSIAST